MRLSFQPPNTPRGPGRPASMVSTPATNAANTTPAPASPEGDPIDPAKVAADPPFYRVYDSREELLKTIREYAISKGYVVTVNRSSPDRNIYMGCDRGGVYRDRASLGEPQKRRRTNTRRTGCEFQLYAKKSSLQRSDGKWHIKVLNGEHNHDLGTLVNHPGARVITPDQKKMINFLISEKMPPRKIIAALKQGYPDLLIIPRDIYNLKMVYQREEREKRERELPEQRAKRERLEQLANVHREQRERLERDHKEQRDKLEQRQQGERDEIEKTGHLERGEESDQSHDDQEPRGGQTQREELEQLQQLQQLQQFEQLEELANHVRGRV